MSTLTREMESQTGSEGTNRPTLEKIARLRCADLLRTVNESFSPSDPIEAIVILAFTHGAAWALDIDMEEAVRKGWAS